MQQAIPHKEKEHKSATMNLEERALLLDYVTMNSVLYVFILLVGIGYACFLYFDPEMYETTRTSFIFQWLFPIGVYRLKFV